MVAEVRVIRLTDIRVVDNQSKSGGVKFSSFCKLIDHECFHFLNFLEALVRFLPSRQSI